MHRRKFIAAAAAALSAATLRASELPDDMHITRVVGFDLTSRRNKLAGKNARLDVHGDRGHDRMLRIYTNAGLEGIGNSGISAETAAGLLGKNPFGFHQPSQRRVTGPFGAGTMPLWDLVGRIAPHNWGSLVGFYMELHVGRAVSNFYRAEHDPLASDAIVADGYRTNDGLVTVPDTPGFGLSIDESAFAREAKVRFDVKS